MNYLILPYIYFIISSFLMEFAVSGFQLGMWFGIITIMFSVPILGPLNTLFLILCDGAGWFKGILRNPIVVIAECLTIASVFFSLLYYFSENPTPVVFVIGAYLILIPIIKWVYKLSCILNKKYPPTAFKIKNIPNETIAIALIPEFFSALLVCCFGGGTTKIIVFATCLWLIAGVLTVGLLYRYRAKINIHV